MPSISRSSAMPAIIHSKAGPSKKGRVVDFAKDPVSTISRPVNMAESWAAYDFEMHARNCAFCEDPYHVHRHHGQLCDQGHRLAQEVARYIYSNADGEAYSTLDEDHKPVRLELPAGHDQVRGLLKAIDRGIRHRSRTPIVSMDRTYYVASRTAPSAPAVKLTQAQSKSKSRPRSGEIVDWPDVPRMPAPKPKTKVLTEVNNSVRVNRGSLYESDLKAQRQNAKRYNVEVREPSARDLRGLRLSGYYT